MLMPGKLVYIYQVLYDGHLIPLDARQCEPARV